MNLKELKKSIKSNFPHKVYKHKADIDGGAFILKKEIRNLIFVYGITNYIDEFKVGWIAGIRFNELETINEEAINMDVKGDSITQVLHDEKNNPYGKGSSLDYEIKSEEDVIKMYEQLN